MNGSTSNACTYNIRQNHELNSKRANMPFKVLKETKKLVQVLFYDLLGLKINKIALTDPSI